MAATTPRFVRPSAQAHNPATTGVEWRGQLRVRLCSPRAGPTSALGRPGLRGKCGKTLGSYLAEQQVTGSVARYLNG
jgi:hypothetical protein